MFSQLCRARLWPKPRHKNNDTGSTSEKTVVAEETQKESKKKNVIPEDIPKIKNSTPETSAPATGFHDEKEIRFIRKEVTSELKGTQLSKTTSSGQQENTNTKHSQLELYLSWLLKISETQKVLPPDNGCSCGKSTDNPAYGLDTTAEQPLQKSRLACRKECPARKPVEENPVEKRNADQEFKESKTQPVVRLQASITHKEGSRIRVSICKPKLKREKSGRSDVSVSSRSRLNSCTGAGETRSAVTPSENRVHKRRQSSSRRRMTSLQNQQAIEEVVNMFGKQFNKALMNQRKSIGVSTARTATVGNTVRARVSNQTGSLGFPEVQKSLPRVSRATISRPNQTRQVPEVGNTESEKSRSQCLETDVQLQNASKDRPANTPMVVMQCSRFVSHLRKEPPFLESSLPMGSLVTALCSENEWLFVRTAHGQEGYVYSTCCVPLGTLPKKRTLAPQTGYSPQLTILKECATSHPVREDKRHICEAKTKQLPVSKPRAKEKISTFSPESTSTLVKKHVKKPGERLEPSTYVMIRDYKGVGDNALNLKKGDVVTGVKRQQEDWVLAKMVTGEFGYIPLSYTVQVELL